MKLAADSSIDRFLVRIEKVKGNQDQHDRDDSKYGLERGSQEEIEGQTELFLFSWDRVELIQQALTHFEFRQTNKRLRSFFQIRQKQSAALA